MRKNWSFDGKGINGGDEYMSRIATLTEHGHCLNAGKLLAAAPDLLAALEGMMHKDYADLSLSDKLSLCENARAAIAMARG